MSESTAKPRLRRYGIVVVLGLVLAALFVLLDFSAGYAGSTVQTSLTNALPSEKRDPLPVRNRSLHIALEGSSRTSRLLAEMVRAELSKGRTFDTIEIGGDEAPLLRMRVETQGMWLALFATGSSKVQFMFMSHRGDFDPTVPLATVSDLRSTPEQVDAVASGTIEGQATHYGPISLPHWRQLVLQTAARNIATVLAELHEDLRGKP